MTAEPVPGGAEHPFSQSLSTDLTVPAWRKCDLVFNAARHCRVDTIYPWPGFRLEGHIALPLVLRRGETLRLRLANHTGIDHMGGAMLHGVHVLAGTK